jgi:hypothetical protein
MYYCTYVSSASNPLPDAELMNIKEKSGTASKKSGVTGLLVFHRNTFIHYCEGEESTVKAMFASTSKDKRYKDVKVLSEGKLKERQFSNWAMELRVLDKDPLFSAGDLNNDSEGVKKRINDCFMSIT